MKRIISAIIALFMVALTLSAQKKVVVEHSYSGFSSVETGESFQLSFIQSDEYKIRIISDPVIENYILAYAKDGVLYLNVDLKAMPSDVRKNFKSGDHILSLPQVEIYAPTVSSISISGDSVIDSDHMFTVKDLTLTVTGRGYVRNMKVKADSFLLDLGNRAYAYMDIVADSFNLQCRNNSHAELKIDAGRLMVSGSSFAVAELYGTADSISISAEGNSKITIDSSKE